MSEVTLQGTIASLKIARSTDKWDTYEVAFPDGSVEKVAHARDREPLKIGDYIECSKGQWNWLTQGVNNSANGGSQSSAGNGKAGGERAERPHRVERGEENKTYTPPTKSTGNNREDYWQHKAEYEEQRRDPKIEAQFYAAQAVAIYAAGIPYLEEKPANTEELNAYFQLALDKARSVFNEINTKD